MAPELCWHSREPCQSCWRQGLGTGLVWGHPARLSVRGTILVQDPDDSRAGQSGYFLPHSVDDASAGNSDSQGLICRRHSCLAGAGVPPAQPCRPVSSPRHSQAPGNILPFPRSSVYRLSQVLSVSNPTLPITAAGPCLPSGSSCQQLSLFSILPQKVVKSVFHRARRSRGIKRRHCGSLVSMWPPRNLPSKLEQSAKGRGNALE